MAVPPRPRPPAPHREPLGNRVVMASLRSPLHRLVPGPCELRFRGGLSGRPVILPVQCARDADRVVVYVGRSASKRWWRNFRSPHAVQVRILGVAHRGVGRVVDGTDPDRVEAERVYHSAHPRTVIARHAPLVVITLNEP